MKMNKQFEFPLTAAGAEECAALLAELPSKYLKDDSHLAALQENLKKLILNLEAHYGSDVEHTFSISATERLRKLHISIKYAGAKYDPRIMSGTDDEYGDLAGDVMSKYSLFAADHRYIDDENILHISLGGAWKLTSFHKILLAMILGLGLGFLGMFLSADTRESLLEILWTFKTTILNLIIMSSTLTVFTMVINSISGFKSIESVKKTGLGILKYHSINYAIALLVTFAFSFHGVQFTTAEGGAGTLRSLADFSSLLSDMLPENYVSPLVDCNFLHIIIIAFLLGFAMLAVGEDAKPVREFFLSAELVSSRIMSWFSGLIPLFLFAMAPSLIWNNDLALISDAFLYLIFILVSIFLSAFFFFVYMCIKTKLPFVGSLKKILPAMLQGFLTANSALSVPQIQFSAKSFGVKDSFNGYATAVGFIFSHVGIMIMGLVLVFGLLPVTGIAITIPTVIRVVVAAILFSLAVPPTSGGNVAIITILFEMIGISDYYLAVIAPVLLIADFAETSMRCGEIVMGTVLAASKMGELEQSKISDK